MLTLLPTPIGNIGDITYRTVQMIKSCNLILCEDTRVTKQLLKLLNERLNADIGNIDILSFHEHNGKERLSQIEGRLKEESVVYLSDAGMPCISDPGQLLVEYCQKEGIEYDVLPGASVAPLIYAASGFESGKFLFYGFLPKKGKERVDELKKVLNNSLDTIIYEAPHRIVKLIEQICDIDKNREIFCAKEISKRYQKFYRVSAIDLQNILKNSSVKGEWTLVIKGIKSSESTLNISDIQSIDIPPKAKAKLIAKLTGKSIKECYQDLLNI